MPSLTLAEARARAAQLSDVSYGLEIDLIDEQTFGSRVTIRFASNRPETFLELHRGEDVTVTVNGDGVDPAYDGHRIQLTGLRTDAENEVVVEARLHLRRPTATGCTRSPIPPTASATSLVVTGTMEPGQWARAVMSGEPARSSPRRSPLSDVLDTVRPDA